VRILWYSVAPWEPGGYGSQTGIWCQRLQAAGHEVAVAAYHGLHGIEITWNGIRVFPAPQFASGPRSSGSVLGSHVRKWQPDLVVLLCDFWFHGQAFAELEPFTPGVKVAAWVPTDSDPINPDDTAILLGLGERLGMKCIAMSRHGQEQMAAKGIDSVYIPHGIDTMTFRPLSQEERAQVREANGLAPGTFAVGWRFSNADPFRKGQYEGLRAFAQFHRRYPDSMLFCHTMVYEEGSKRLDVIAGTEGILDAIRWADHQRMQEGSYSAEELASMDGAMDVCWNPSLGEGFGITAVEAQACGTPVILPRGTTGPELVGPSGWLASTQPWWNDRHASRWHLPLIWSLEEKLKMAHKRMGDLELRARCREFAEQYEVENVWPLWDAALPDLAS
jgi:glycosyltransferase involved in cell wall biosynthesis